YAGGIDTVRGVVGSRYVAPALGTRAMTGLADDWWNLWLRLAGPDLSPQPAHTITALDRAATWTAANRIIYHGPEIFAVTFDPRYGLVTGVYFDATRGVNVRFEGVLLQDQGLVTGAYRAPGPGGPVSPVSGLFLAEPR
ncbi:MAG: hypothetical protein JNK37_02850, partial [Verrucomicrobiales bacterium]|nr:hypothetical protein [Verrucomicrobiales bacterium]